MTLDKIIKYLYLLQSYQVFNMYEILKFAYMLKLNIMGIKIYTV